MLLMLLPPLLPLLRGPRLVTHAHTARRGGKTGAVSYRYCMVARWLQVMGALALPAIVWGIPTLPLWVFGRPFGVWLTGW